MVCKDLEIKNLGEYYDLYVERDTFLQADVFNNIHNISLEIYGLDSACSLSAPGLALQRALKKSK